MRIERKLLATTLLACAPLSLAFMASSANANTLNWTVALDNEAVAQDVYSDELNQKITSSNFIVRPQLYLNYTSKRANGFWRATHNHVRRSLDDADVTNNYTNYAYGASFDAIENLLSFSATGALNYQNAAANGFLVDNFLLNAENLSKTRSNRFGANFNLPRGDYFGHTTQVNYSITESERRENSFIQLNSDVLSVSTNTFTGDNFERFSAQIGSNFSVSDRGDNGDYTTRELNANLFYRLVGNFGVNLTASHEANQVASEEVNFSQLREFNTAGAGVIWRPAVNKQIALTWNRAGKNEIEEDEDNSGYVGVDIDWQFTPRTQLAASYSRRFFGESGELRFQHRIKKFRTQVTYTEEVTSFSRLIAEPGNLGVFVCSDGITDLSACFQPSSLSYQLQANEQFIQFTAQNAEINDELILRKNLSWQLGGELRRTKLSFNGRYATNDYLESNRLSRTYSAGTSLSFQIGQKTNFSWTNNAAFTTDITEIGRGESEVLTTKVSVTRDLGRYFKLAFDVSYLERRTEGNVVQSLDFSGIDGDLQDRRVSLTLKYSLSK